MRGALARSSHLLSMMSKPHTTQYKTSAGGKTVGRGPLSSAWARDRCFGGRKPLQSSARGGRAGAHRHGPVVPRPVRAPLPCTASRHSRPARPPLGARRSARAGPHLGRHRRLAARIAGQPRHRASPRVGSVQDWLDHRLRSGARVRRRRPPGRTGGGRRHHRRARIGSRCDLPAGTRRAGRADRPAGRDSQRVSARRPAAAQSFPAAQSPHQRACPRRDRDRGQRQERLAHHGRVRAGAGKRSHGRARHRARRAQPGRSPADPRRRRAGRKRRGCARGAGERRPSPPRRARASRAPARPKAGAPLGGEAAEPPSPKATPQKTPSSPPSTRPNPRISTSSPGVRAWPRRPCWPVWPNWSWPARLPGIPGDGSCVVWGR